ncbi:MAG: cell division protein FtsZ [Chitinophagaceae bacterium]
MIHFDLPKEKSSILKVIGVGGGGSNAVNHMFNQNIENVNFIICNTDAQAIAQSKVPNKVQLGPHLTQGLGAGANPEIGKQATEESLEEIKRILEVNTKMAFITAGMGGGTGTGGAPIISKICKDLGILTVGIVTTPFAYEGRKRQLQAEEGIEQLKKYVDTLLVISNDKLRHQFGNLKMKDAFAKADNVLATAAKCITDVINSTGQINVDFADVCTVMRDGGVAILGSATAEGDTRAQKAIEEALNSPLLNDNDIRGAKWILININSAEGEHEFTMDEVEIIQNYLLSHAGQDTDVILGLGYDNTLERRIGITLIATGFDHKTPFYKQEEKVPEPKKEEKIVMTLNIQKEEEKLFRRNVTPPEEKKDTAPAVEKKAANLLFGDELTTEQKVLMPTLVETQPVVARTATVVTARKEAEIKMPTKNDEILKFELTPSSLEETTPVSVVMPVEMVTEPEPGKTAGTYVSQPVKIDRTAPEISMQASSPTNSSVSTISGGYLAKPSKIYAEQPVQINNTTIPSQNTVEPIEDDRPLEMQLIIKEDVIAEPEIDQNQAGIISEDDLAVEDVVEDQKRRATERIQKLRNLSFNINGTDTNNEFDTVPAYIRRNLELYNTVNNVENFYSNYTVKPEENNKSQISTINTFLDGKKPD